MIISETISRRTDLKWNEKAVLAAYASVNNEETPTIDIMASMLGMDVQAVKMARKSLIEKGLLVVKGHSVKAVTGADNQPGSTAFYTLVSKSFNKIDKYIVSEELPPIAQLQQMNDNLANITMENGQNIADVYFKFYLNTALTWNFSIEELVKIWNRCIYNKRYQLIGVDGVSYV